MNSIKTIFCKELRRVLFDKKMIFALFILPILMMVVIYGVMVIMIQHMRSDIAQHVPSVVIMNEPDSFARTLDAVKEARKKEDSEKKEKMNQAVEDAASGNIKDSQSLYDTADAIAQAVTSDSVMADISLIDTKKELKKAQNDVLSGKTDMVIEFPKGFDEQVENYKTGDSVPDIKTYYNPSEDYSASVDSDYETVLEDYRQMLLKKRVGDMKDIQVFTMNASNDQHEIQDDQKAGGKMLGSIIPYLVSILLFAGVMSLGTDAIAGEKERGTMATMLVAPVKRTSIVLGKIFALMVLAFLSALIYAVSMLGSVPLMAAGMEASGMSFSLNPVQILEMILVTVTMVMVYVALICLISVFAKDTKEASTFVTPVYMVVIVAGMFTMFVTGKPAAYSYAIPLYGSSMAMRSILTREITGPEVLVCCLVNVVCGVVMVYAIAKAFDNERVMFDA